MRLRILIACEFSGVVRDAFTARGHDAWSCDLLPSEKPGNHIIGDVRDVLHNDWDLMVAHPPCTHLSSSGAQYWPDKKRDGRQQAAIDFVLSLYDAPIPRVAIENPVGILSTVWRKPDQIIQPYQFGDAFTKKTCLWFRGVPPLLPSLVVAPQFAWGTNSKYGGRRRDGGRRLNPLPVLHADGHHRSITFPGIAEAMADQWGRILTTGKDAAA